jgi:hypothetical protein
MYSYFERAALRVKTCLPTLLLCSLQTYVREVLQTVGADAKHDRCPAQVRQESQVRLQRASL